MEASVWSARRLVSLLLSRRLLRRHLHFWEPPGYVLRIEQLQQVAALFLLNVQASRHITETLTMPVHEENTHMITSPSEASRCTWKQEDVNQPECSAYLKEESVACNGTDLVAVGAVAHTKTHKLINHCSKWTEENSRRTSENARRYYNRIF